jgi:magnesium and cobalt transporter
MTVLDAHSSTTELLHQIGNSGHSRFPVMGENKDEVVGILLAKDLLKFSNQKDNGHFEIKNFLRSPTFIPESKRLKILLNEFRKSRNHMAIVVDEYGRIAGLLTIEDVLEQIVGDIEDEFDAEDLPMIREKGKGRYEVDALIRIEDFNEFFETQYLDEDFDTLGGMIINKLGKFPKKGESLLISPLKFKILKSDSRRLQLIEERTISDAYSIALTSINWSLLLSDLRILNFNGLINRLSPFLGNLPNLLMIIPPRVSKSSSKY